MEEYIKHKHIGVYGLIIKENKILLIKKKTGPYDGKLDLPGGSFEFGERPEETLKREFQEETGLNITKFNLYDTDSVLADWYHENKYIKVHHIGIFYQITEYQNDIKTNIDIDEINDDSLGADFYEINKLTKDNLSNIAILELEKLGYHLT